MEKIKKYSRILRVIFWVFTFGLPFASALYWYFAPGLPEQAYVSLPVPLARVHWNHWTRLLAFFVTLPSTLLLAWIFFLLRGLFQNYEMGSIFSLENAEQIHRVGKALLVYLVVEILQVPLLSLALTFQNPSGQKLISASLGSNDLFRIVVVMVVFVLGWIHKEAFRINEESKLTI